MRKQEMVASAEHPVKKLLREKGITQKQLADELGVCPSLISRVLNREKNSPRVMLYIALRFKMRFEELWGRAA